MPGHTTRGFPKPSRLLAATVGLQWLVTAGVALAASHVGSVYGDATAARRTIDAASRVANGTLPTVGGPLYPLMLAPLASITTDARTVSSAVTTVTILVLAPLASYYMLDVAHRIAGRIYAIAAVLVWLLLPVAALPFVLSGYDSTYIDYALPAIYGLTVHPAYLAMVLSLAAASFALRAAAGAPRAAFVAGLLSAAVVACLPIAGGIAAGIVVALLVGRRWRGLGEAIAGFAAGIAPTLIWRHGTQDATVTLGHPSWAGFQASMANLREFSWSNRVLQWLPVAGTIGLFRLARPAAGMVAGWIAVAALLGIATAPPFDRGQILIGLIPAWPAYALAVAAIPALVPTVIRRLGPRVDSEPGMTAASRTTVWAAFILVVLLQLALVSVIAR